MLVKISIHDATRWIVHADWKSFPSVGPAVAHIHLRFRGKESYSYADQWHPSSSEGKNKLFFISVTFRRSFFNIEFFLNQDRHMHLLRQFRSIPGLRDVI